MQLTFSNIDYLLILIAVVSIYDGWRRGFILGIFSIFGIGFGLWLGNTTLNYLYGASESVDPKRVSISTIVFLIGIAAGSAFGMIFGSFIQRLIAKGPIKFINKILGAAFSILSLSFVTWLVSSYLVLLPNPTINTAINDSTVIAKLDELAPDDLRSYVDLAKSYAIESQLPEVAIEVIIGPEIPEPDPLVVQNENIAAALDSVVRIESIAEECNAKLSGSGFVIADNLVVTNAHVVAGITKPNVRVGGKGKAVNGEIIYFDPRVDLALIKTSKLTAPPLLIGDDLRRNDMAVIAGFPGGGSLTLIPARVKAIAESVDSDIYGMGSVTRELYVLNADVKQGDSGAALINEEGNVSGVIFAASAAQANVGYALSIEELNKALEKIKLTSEPVETGKCIPIDEK